MTIGDTPPAPAAALSSAVADNDPQPLSLMEASSGMTGYWTEKVVLVTGSSSGLGRALGRPLHAAELMVGFRPLGRCARNGSPRTFRSFGTQVLAIPADVTQLDQVDSLIEQTVKHFGRLDVLVEQCGSLHPRGVARNHA